jgi:hypothetical protein
MQIWERFFFLIRCLLTYCLQSWSDEYVEQLVNSHGNNSVKRAIHTEGSEPITFCCNLFLNFYYKLTIIISRCKLQSMHIKVQTVSDLKMKK